MFQRSKFDFNLHVCMFDCCLNTFQDDLLEFLDKKGPKEVSDLAIDLKKTLEAPI